MWLIVALRFLNCLWFFPLSFSMSYICGCVGVLACYCHSRKSLTLTASPHQQHSQPPIEKYLTEGRWKCTAQYSRCRFWMADWVVNICATFSLRTPLSCFPAFARSLSVFRWTWCQGLYMSSSHARSWKRFLCDSKLFLWWHTELWLELLLVIVQKGRWFEVED